MLYIALIDVYDVDEKKNIPASTILRFADKKRAEAAQSKGYIKPIEVYNFGDVSKLTKAELL